jgi:hypothetical protein
MKTHCPELQSRIQQLKTHKGWGSAASEQRAMDYLHDARIAGLDAKAGDLLAQIDELGHAGEKNPPDCTQLAALDAASLELLAVMKAKLRYTQDKIAREISGSAETAGAQADPFANIEKKRRANATETADPFLLPEKAEKSETTSQPPATSQARVAQKAAPQTDTAPDAPTAKPAPPKTAATSQSPASNPVAAQKPALQNQENTQAARLNTETANPAPRSPQVAPWRTRTERSDDAEPYTPPLAGTPLPPIDQERQVALNDPADALRDGLITQNTEGYTIDEIRNATRGFFGTISTNLASVIEHAFQNWGRPTGYILGKEGGGAFLAGLRYGEGTFFPRFGQRRQIYWHGPSLGYDFGAAGSRTLILVYAMNQPDDIYRTFTGVDGSAYLVGGVGMTVLKGGPVIMTPIRSGLGLRIGANVGYLRFTSEPTWNPF